MSAAAHRSPSTPQLVAVATLAALALAGAAHARRGAAPPSRTLAAQPLEAVAVLALPPIERAALVAADASPGTGAWRTGPLRIATPSTVAVGPRDGGSWEPLPDGSWLWRLRIHAPGATDLSLGFRRFRLPEGATLHLASERHDYWEGPYTAADHKPHGQLWLPVVPGDRAVLELRVPAAGLGGVELELTRVARGFRDLFGLEPALADDCNLDVVCAVSDGWEDQIRSVGRYTILGVTLCTGTLVNNAEQDLRPLFLTANHCGITSANDATVVVYWNFQSRTCGKRGGGSLSQNQTGATLRAARADVDGTLLELDDVPDPLFGVYFAGWDRRRTRKRTGSVTIHHPQGDEKAISFNTDPLIRDGECAAQANWTDHWVVDDWELGTTESGSSGAPLFDPSNGRIIGTLHGGNASCDFPQGLDCYGMFGEFWRGDDPESRARDWLDPDRTKRKTLAGLDSQCDCANATHLGTPGNDHLVGTGGRDIICGLGGDDVLIGRGGNDCLEGGPGDDDLQGNRGHDVMHGGPGDDVCDGARGQDAAGGCETTKRVP